MGKTKNNRMTVSTFTRARKAKTMKNVNTKRRSKGGSRGDFVENRDTENMYGYQDKEDVDNNLEELDTSEEEENDNRWDFLYNMFSFLF
jgi:hypothetical protein